MKGIPMKIIRNGQSGGQGARFTGEVKQTRVLDQQRAGGVSVSIVEFKDGATTHWHVHPGEQILIVKEGEGLVGTEGREPQTINPGDIIHEHPGERHWHGAAPGKNMTHISITTNGSPTWFEAPER